jgi:hypothetical protein
MKVRSLRRVTNDTNHNAFTGACWFQDALYIAFRQGDAHVDPNGKIVVLRSRDEGLNFDIVAVIRGEFDTRDAHLHTDGKRLFVNGFEADTNAPGGTKIFPGTAWTDNGLNWSQWTRTNGADDYVLWRPQYFRNRHFCAGYTVMLDGALQENWNRVAWFQSDDGVNWEELRVLHEGADRPSECALDFHADGRAAMLMRRDFQAQKPLLLLANPPYDSWREIEIDLPLVGPALWFVGDEIWISGRWFAGPDVAHVAVFQIVDDKPVFRMVLPSGPGRDCSYMGVARHPRNRKRFFLSYYSEHAALDNPTVSQWGHPDIYLADVTFDAEFIREWRVSRMQTEYSLAGASCPNAALIAEWKTVSLTPQESNLDSNFIDVSSFIGEQSGVIYLSTDLEVGPCDEGFLHLGYDGPVKVWLNGEQVFEGAGSNPAVADETSIPVRFQHGTNHLVIALDTNKGKAQGIFARYEKT